MYNLDPVDPIDPDPQFYFALKSTFIIFIFNVQATTVV